MKALDLRGIVPAPLPLLPAMDASIIKRSNA